MITQAIKQWLQKMFAWWPWRQSARSSSIPTSGALHKTASEMTARSAMDGVRVAPQPEVTPRRPTIEEWPERIVQSYLPGSEERSETSFPPPPTLPKGKGREDTLHTRDDSHSAISPTPERKLEFLRYLVKRGVVNEGFAEGKIPDQYRQE